ncbi:4Fe-4S binding protein [Chloroflexota bacterium]
MSDEQKSGAANTALHDFLSKLDVDAMGIVSLDAWKGTRLDESALKLLPQARSVVVFAMEICPEVLDLTSPGRIMGAPSLNEYYTSDGDYVNGRLNKTAHDAARASRKMGYKAFALPARGYPVDSRFLETVLSYKHAAQAAGMGKMGWQSLLITPWFGPRVRLSACLTESVLEPTAIDTTLECDGCGICVENCPVGALSVPQDGNLYAINKYACAAFRNNSGGCVECMRLCPLGR